MNAFWSFRKFNDHLPGSRGSISVLAAVLGCVGEEREGGLHWSPHGVHWPCLQDKPCTQKNEKQTRFGASRNLYQNTLPVGRSLWNVQPLLGILSVSGHCSGPSEERLRVPRVLVFARRCPIKCPYTFQGGWNKHLTVSLMSVVQSFIPEGLVQEDSLHAMSIFPYLESPQDSVPPTSDQPFTLLALVQLALSLRIILTKPGSLVQALWH